MVKRNLLASLQQMYKQASLTRTLIFQAERLL